MAQISKTTVHVIETMRVIKENPGITSKSLAKTMGVDSRSARRYINTLSAIGVNVKVTYGPYGGYTIDENERIA